MLAIASRIRRRRRGVDRAGVATAAARESDAPSSECLLSPYTSPVPAARATEHDARARTLRYEDTFRRRRPAVECGGWTPLSATRLDASGSEGGPSSRPV